MSLEKLMVSNGLPCLTVIDQIAFDQRNLYSTPDIEFTIDHHSQALVSKM